MFQRDNARRNEYCTRMQAIKEIRVVPIVVDIETDATSSKGKVKKITKTSGSDTYVEKQIKY